MIKIAKVYFRFGTMDSSKTARLVMDAHEYTQKGEFVLPIKPVIDTRSKKGLIESRVGISTRCLDLEQDYNIYNHVKDLKLNQGIEVSCVLIDEAQFLTMAQVIQLRLVADNLDIPVMCYGLKSDFRGNLFAGSKALFEYANRFEEIKTTCRVEGCKKKAMFNVRYDKNGNPTFSGEQVKLGDTKQEDEGTEYYIVKCSSHFLADYVKFEEENAK
ncbi:thymidine kinase [Viridibacillus arvi]|uniref:thymidine kinase n=1 Tax=Viridibacillus arvi TaxID=263475 RepID=UPI0034CF4F22